MARPGLGSESPPTLFLVDGDPLARRLIQPLLSQASYALETYSCAQALLANGPGDRPGCVITELRLPDMDGLALQAALRQQRCRQPVLFLSAHADVAAAVRAIKAGAIDFLLKPCAGEVLAAAVAGAIALDSKYRKERHDKAALQARFDTLTLQENKICRLVAEGLANKEIASDLKIAEQTVRLHRHRAMRKIAANSVADLMRLLTAIASD